MLRITVALSLALWASSCWSADPTSNLVAALHADSFDGDAVRAAVEAGADTNVHMCRPEKEGRSDAPVLHGTACTNGFIYSPLWAVSGMPYVGPDFSERVAWIQYLRKHGAKPQRVYANDSRTELPIENMVLWDFEPDSREAQLFAATLSELIRTGWKQGVSEIVKSIDGMRSLPRVPENRLAVFRRVGQQTGTLVTIDAAIANLRKTTDTPNLALMTPVLSAPISAILPKSMSGPTSAPVAQFTASTSHAKPGDFTSNSKLSVDELHKVTLDQYMKALRVAQLDSGFPKGTTSKDKRALNFQWLDPRWLQGSHLEWLNYGNAIRLQIADRFIVDKYPSIPAEERKARALGMYQCMNVVTTTFNMAKKSGVSVNLDGNRVTDALSLCGLSTLYLPGD